MGNRLFKKIFVVMLLCSTAMMAKAQWSLGIKGGWDYTSITRSNAGRIDEAYSSKGGYDVGIQARYGFTDWFALRADLSVMRRSHRMDRNLDALYYYDLVSHHRSPQQLRDPRYLNTLTLSLGVSYRF